MLIKKGQMVEIHHKRKGVFIAVAKNDFESEKEDYSYPVVVAPGAVVSGLASEWLEGEAIPCNSNLVTSIKLIN